MVSQDFWNKKRVLITGHTGFKGSWLSIWLNALGAEVIGYALAAPTSPSLFDLSNIATSMKSVISDVRDYARLKTTIEEYKPEIIIHMAAQPLVRLSYEQPIETYETNVMGTVHLLEAARQAACAKAIVIVTSDKCYQNNEWVYGYRETDPMGGYDPYSNSKGCAELVTSAYINSYFNPKDYDIHQTAVASARAGNVIGGGDWASDRLIPDLIRGFMNNETVKIRSPHAIRPWQHVLEPLSGYMKLAESLYNNGSEYSGGWNFGPKDEDAKPVSWIVERLVNQWGNKASWKLDTNLQPHEAHYLKLDCSKANLTLGWQPKWNLEDALAHTVKWFKGYQNNPKDSLKITLKDINTYSNQQSTPLEQTHV